MDDVLIVGAGVVGLSLAYELSGRGLAVRVIERETPGREASWAGAGILPPANRATATDAYAALHGLSIEIHRQWAERLRAQTGVDTGFRRCGGVYLSSSPLEAQLLELALLDWQQRGIQAERLTFDEARHLEPALGEMAGEAPAMIVHLPDEAQIRNPRHLRALEEACRAAGVLIECGVTIEALEHHGPVATAALADDARRPARHICLTTGAWSGKLAAHLGVELPIVPVRGQIVLMKTERPLLTRVINEGARYLVPRDDGHLIVGSTEEEVGFVKHTTEEGIAGLLELACRLVPALRGLHPAHSWAGLRPGTPDGMPYIGRLPGWDNVTLAAGHYRSGLTLSTGTARVLAQLIADEEPEVELTAFRVGRKASRGM